MAARFDVGFSVREPAWHGLAKVLADYPGRDAAMEEAGHNWLVIERPIWMNEGEDPNSHLVSIEGWKALKRSDTGAILSVVKDSYTPIQNSVLWDIVDARYVAWLEVELTRARENAKG